MKGKVEQNMWDRRGWKAVVCKNVVVLCDSEGVSVATLPPVMAMTLGMQPFGLPFPHLR